LLKLQEMSVSDHCKIMVLHDERKTNIPIA